MVSTKWNLTEEEQQKYTEALACDLGELRETAGISQSALSNLIGISRQLYAGIESHKREMSWSVYMSLICFFEHNLITRDILLHSNGYPLQLFLRMNEGQSLAGWQEQEIEEVQKIAEKLDESARYRIVPETIVVHSFSGFGYDYSFTEDDLERMYGDI